jgi:non-ribosomal peptide synthetase-like protein
VVPADPKALPDFGSLREELRAQLPAVMVPGRFVAIAALPTTVGGKLDRRALPEPPAEHPRRAAAAPDDPLQAHLLRCLDGLLPGGPAVGPDDDFFVVGGDSLRAAQWISALRNDPRTAPLTVRDVYEARTVAGLAARALDSATPTTPADSAAAPAATAPRGEEAALLLTGQVLWLTAMLGLGSALLVLLARAVPLLVGAFGPTATCLLLPLLSLAGIVVYAACTVTFAVATKRALLGTCRPGAVPVWSTAFLRHWIVQQAVRLVPWSLLQGTELQCTVLRWLGARIGARVHIHRGVDLQRGGWDLLTLGDDAVLSQDASLLLAELHAGHLVLAPVSIGARSTVDVRACVDGGAALGDDAFLTASSWLAPGQRIGAGERWNGIPATPAGSAPPAVIPDPGHRALSATAHTLSSSLLRMALTLAQALPMTCGGAVLLAAFGADGAAVCEWLLAPWSAALWMVLAFTAAALPLQLLWQALLARWLAPAAPGHFPLRSLPALRIHACTGLVHNAGEWLSGTLFWPYWLRLAGMRIGPRCEISTILDTVPRHVRIGGDTFFADGVYFAGPRLHRGCVSLLPTSIGDNTFVGNHAVVPIGQHLPGDLLLGVSTVADDDVMERGTDWFGHPPFRLPRREVVHADRRLTHEPNLLRRLNRTGWEVLRWFLPWVPLLLGLWWYEVVAAAPDRAPWQSTAVAMGASLLAALAICGFVLATKWLLLGAVRPGHHALWSCWCSRWDFFYVAWHRLARPLLTNLEGTLLLPWYLRAMGARIGRRTVLGPGFAQLVDPDMIHIGDGATVHAQFQAHSFEDRVLKIDHLHIRAGASIGHGTVLLYGADIGERTRVAPQAVVMKQERLAPDRLYEGFPVRLAVPRRPGPRN